MRNNNIRKTSKNEKPEEFIYKNKDEIEEMTPTEGFNKTVTEIDTLDDTVELQARYVRPGSLEANKRIKTTTINNFVHDRDNYDTDESSSDTSDDHYLAETQPKKLKVRPPRGYVHKSATDTRTTTLRGEIDADPSDVEITMSIVATEASTEASASNKMRTDNVEPANNATSDLVTEAKTTTEAELNIFIQRSERKLIDNNVDSVNTATSDRGLKRDHLKPIYDTSSELGDKL